MSISTREEESKDVAKDTKAFRDFKEKSEPFVTPEKAADKAECKTPHINADRKIEREEDLKFKSESESGLNSVALSMD